MYNKYFTMKRSELKEVIKAEIKSVLSEEITEAKFIKFKGDSDDMKMKVEAEREMNTPDGELKVYTVKTDDGVQSYTADQVEVVNEIAPMGPGQTTTLADLEDEDLVTVSQKEIKMHLDQFFGGNIDGNDLANAIEDIVMGASAPRGMMREEDEEPSSADLKKKDSVATISNKLQKLIAKMKDKAKEFKAAEGEAKEKIKDELKSMTAEKKKLEKSL